MKNRKGYEGKEEKEKGQVRSGFRAAARLFFDYGIKKAIPLIYDVVFVNLHY